MTGLHIGDGIVSQTYKPIVGTIETTVGGAKGDNKWSSGVGAVGELETIHKVGELGTS